MLRALAHLGSLRGRASRTEFAWVFLGGFVLSLLLFAVYLAPVPPSLRLVLGLLGWVLLYAGVAVSVRRLHDLGKSGWLLLLWPIPMVGVVFMVWFFFRPGVSGI